MIQDILTIIGAFVAIGTIIISLASAFRGCASIYDEAITTEKSKREAIVELGAKLDSLKAVIEDCKKESK